MDLVNRRMIPFIGPYAENVSKAFHHCPACRTYLIATRFWVVVICPIIKCLTVLEFSFILFDLCLFITIFNFILNYVPIVIFWIFTYHKIWILLIIDLRSAQVYCVAIFLTCWHPSHFTIYFLLYFYFLFMYNHCHFLPGVFDTLAVVAGNRTSHFLS